MAISIATQSTELRPVPAEGEGDELQAVIRAIYRQVLGNTHVMESQQLITAESRLRNGDITVREFVRELAQSELYRSLFFETSSPYRFVELNHKHLLGRAPQDQTEIAAHVQRCITQGYEAEISSYIDSDEYISNFGESVVPRARGNQTQTGLKNVVFNRTSTLNRGYAANDIGKQAQLITIVAGNTASKVQSPSRTASATSLASTSLPSSEGPKTLKDVTRSPYAEDLPVIISSVYRQVLGNTHIMESERLITAESRLRGGEYSVREFVRAIALSDLYRSLFFETSPPYRFVELNFKHLLGRAPQDQAELAEHVQRCITQGYEAEINSYIDSDEYTNSFGENDVPVARGTQTQTGLKNVVFTLTSVLDGGYAANDFGNGAKLIAGIASNLPPRVQAPARSASATSLANTSLPSSEGPKTLKDITRSPYTEDLPVIISSAYRQVLGNTHIMESQRLTSAEARLRNGEFTVKEFVRAIALSDLYRSLFFETSSPYRFVELNFTHLLGRAPQDQAEISEHVQKYNTLGYEAEINSYIDSDEYSNSFGENEVPAARGNQTQTGLKNIVFNRTAFLNEGYAANDIGNEARLITSIARNEPPILKSDDDSANVIINALQNAPSSQEPQTLREVSRAPYIEELPAVIESIYSQVLGNTHVMDSQRLVSTESRFRNGDITVKEFVRELAQSELYRSLFFETSSPYRFIELNFKHLLGRAPQDQAEIAEHVQIYNSQGYEAEINSYIDSDEYSSSFGESLVPCNRGNQTQAGVKNVVFNRTSVLDGGYAANDIGTQAKLIAGVASNLPPKNQAPSRDASAISLSATSLPSSQGPKTLKDITRSPYAEDLPVIINSAYRQVLGNTHIMESQRLTSAEARLRNGEFTVKEFVRAIALSDLYQSLFFETSSPYRFVELNFKHLLGRAPQDQAEISEHVQRYINEGYEAEINSYIDSDEYSNSFGENEVPSARGNQSQVGLKNVVFGRTSTLSRGYAANDIGRQAKLIRDLAGNLPTKIKSTTPVVGAVGSTSKRFRIAVTKASFGRRVARSNTTFEVDYSQLSQKIQNIQKAGSKILSITEVS